MVGRRGDKGRTVGELAEPADDQLFDADREQVGRQDARPVFRRVETAGIAILADFDTRVVEEVLQIDRTKGDLAIGQGDRVDGGRIQQGHGRYPFGFWLSWPKRRS